MVRNKKYIFLFIMMLTLFLGGCNSEKKEVDQNKSKYADLVIERVEGLTKYRDESRLDKDTVYTLDNIGKQFSFVLTRYDENDFKEKEYVYSFVGNDKVSFLRNVSSYEFKYNDVNSDLLREVEIDLEDYNKDNYEEKIKEENYIIEKSGEEDSYVYVDYKTEYDSNYFCMFKFFDNETTMSACFYRSSSDESYNNLDNNIIAAKAVLDTITLDNNHPFLEDQIVSMKNFKGQSLISYRYVDTVDIFDKVIDFNTTGYVARYYMSVDYDGDNFYWYTSNWKILSLDDPYTVISDEHYYKVVKDGIPTYYQFRGYDEHTGDRIYHGETLVDLEYLLKIFYE